MLKLRSTRDSHNGKSTVNDTDSVELEKSNILVMGPTGSGIYNFALMYLNWGLNCCDAHILSVVSY